MLSKETIKDFALANGFKLKEQENGKMDLNPYVYEFANAIAEHCWSAFKSGVMPHKIHPTKASLNNGWISVDDMLPKHQQEVLACNSNSKHFNQVRIAIFEKNSPNGGFLVNGWLDEPKGKITHWQPLPQPPKE